MTKVNLRTAWKRILVAILAIVLTISMMPAKSFAATSDDTFQFVQNPDAFNEHEVLVNGEPWTIYCLQSRYLWPSYEGYDNPSDFSWATDIKHLLTEEQTLVMQKALFAGYPHNGAGIFNDMYSWFEEGDDTSWVDDLPIAITQAAIWQIAADMELPGNEGYHAPEEDYDDYMWDAIQAIIAFAEDPNTVITPPSSSEITFEGSATLTEQQDGTWLAGPISIVDSEGYNLLHTLTVPEGLSIVDEDGNEIFGRISATDEFYIACDDPSVVENGASITATAIATYPTDVTHFVTDSRRRGQTKDENGEQKADDEWIIPGTPQFAMYPVQTMLGVHVEEFHLSGTLLVDADAVELSSLTIEKTAADDHALEAADGKTFTFNVALTGADKFKIDDRDYTLELADISEDGVASNVTQSTITTDGNGVIQISLAVGQEAVIEGIPCGVEYTVTEVIPEDANGTWTPNKNGVSGTISLDEINRVAITNSYVFNAVTSAPLTAQKTIVGEGAPVVEAGQFSFVLSPEKETNPMPEGASADEHGWPYLVATNGTDASASVIDFGTFTFNEPGVYVYTVQEEDVTVPNMSRDASEYVVTFTVENNNGALDITRTITKDGSESALEFNNTYTQGEVDQDFSVVKRIEDSVSNAEHSLRGYQFEIKPDADDTSAYPVFAGTDSSSYTMTSDDNGIANSPVVVFTEAWFNENVADGEDSITLNYTITEKDSAVPGIVNDTDNVRQAQITVTRSGSVDTGIELSSVVMYKGADGEYAHEEPEFVNTYTVEMTSTTLHVDKQFSGDLYKPEPNEGYFFTVTPCEDYGDAALATDISIKWRETGDGSFGWDQGFSGQIQFNAPGIYQFIIAEEDPERDGMDYDKLVWGVRVHVVDDGDGTMSVTSVVYNQEDSLETNTEEATFTNNFETSTEVEFEFTKELIGREWRANHGFRFTVDAVIDTENADDFNPIDDGESAEEHATWTKNVTLGNATDNVATGTVKAKMDTEGTYYFIISEVEGTDKAIAYDDSVYVAKVVVAKEGNYLVAGEPEFFVVPEESWDDKDSVSDIAFENYVSSMEITKVLDDPNGFVDPEATFDIKVSITGDATTNGYEVFIDDEEHLVEFVDGEHTFTVKPGQVIKVVGLPIESEVTVEEVLPEDAEKVFTTVVSVCEGDGEEMLTPGAEVSTTIKAKEDYKVAVNNTLATTSLVIGKIVVDETGEIDVDNEKFEFEITANYGDFDFLPDGELNGEFASKSSLDDREAPLGSVTFENGKATVTVAHNEHLEIMGLPGGTTYTVTEKDPGEYKTEIMVSSEDGITYPITETVTGTEATGELEAGKIDYVIVTNTMEKEPETEEPETDEPETDEPETDDPGNNGGNNGGNGVETGDQTPVTSLISLCVVSLLAAIAILAYLIMRRKYER